MADEKLVIYLHYIYIALYVSRETRGASTWHSSFHVRMIFHKYFKITIDCLYHDTMRFSGAVGDNKYENLILYAHSQLLLSTTQLRVSQPKVAQCTQGSEGMLSDKISVGSGARGIPVVSLQRHCMGIYDGVRKEDYTSTQNRV